MKTRPVNTEVERRIDLLNAAKAQLTALAGRPIPLGKGTEMLWQTLDAQESVRIAENDLFGTIRNLPARRYICRGVIYHVDRTGKGHIQPYKRRSLCVSRTSSSLMAQ